MFDSFLIDPTAPTMIDARNSHARGRRDAVRRGEPGRDLAGLRTARARPERVHEPGSRGRQSLHGNARAGLRPGAGLQLAGRGRTRTSPSTSTRSTRQRLGVREGVRRPLTRAALPDRRHRPGDVQLRQRHQPGRRRPRSLPAATTSWSWEGARFFRFSANLKGGSPRPSRAHAGEPRLGAAGATASGDGTGQALAIDETETTNWSADGRAARRDALGHRSASRSRSTSPARRPSRSRTSRSAR